jgi:hypothetical protein
VYQKRLEKPTVKPDENNEKPANNCSVYTAVVTPVAEIELPVDVLPRANITPTVSVIMRNNMFRSLHVYLRIC